MIGSVVKVDFNKWPRQYRCFVCAKRGCVMPATIRVFSGTYGGGFPACARHEAEAIELAMQPLGAGNKLADGYKVRAYRVESDEDGYPKMTRKLFSAWRKEG